MPLQTFQFATGQILDIPKMALDEIRLFQCVLKLKSICNVLEKSCTLSFTCYFKMHNWVSSVLNREGKIHIFQHQISEYFKNVESSKVSKCSVVSSLICFNLLENIKTFYRICTNITKNVEYLDLFVIAQFNVMLLKMFSFWFIYLHSCKYYVIVYITVLDHWSHVLLMLIILSVPVLAL